MSKPKRTPSLQRLRGRGRRRAVQALYQWQIAGQDLIDIEAQFRDQMEWDGEDWEFFVALLHEVPKATDRLDELLAPRLDRAVAALDPVERAILRIGTYELIERLDVPYRVVINEAVELAKQFGAEQSHKYVNGVLDKIAREQPMRAAEMGAQR